MKRFSVVLFLLAMALPAFAQAQAQAPAPAPAPASASPRLATVTPDTGKADVEFTAAGENLAKAQVAELYLTDGKNDLKVDVLEQTNAAIKFKAPASVKAGRYGLMVLTGDRKQFIEQPVKLTIE